jgi:hypothetical protein
VVMDSLGRRQLWSVVESKMSDREPQRRVGNLRAGKVRFRRWSEWQQRECVLWAACLQRQRGRLHRYRFGIYELDTDVSIRFPCNIGRCTVCMSSGAFQSPRYLRLAIWTEYNAIRQLLVPGLSCYVLPLVGLRRILRHVLLPRKRYRGRGMLRCSSGDF